MRISLKSRKFHAFVLLSTITVVFAFVITNKYVVLKTKSFIYREIKTVPKAYTGIVLGAYVHKSGNLSLTLRDRVDKALELYKSGKIKRFLLSGDHGTKTYDEVNSMKEYLLERNVPTEDIFLDHAGFNTYNSMVRAAKIFGVDKAVVITQAFHLPRAVFIARNQNIEAYGFMADKRKYPAHLRNHVREFLARIKSFVEVKLNVSPKYLGEKIPIKGDSRKSYD